ncbi:MAG: HAD hydrolase-like protein [Sphingomonadaceae bacterium]
MSDFPFDIIGFDLDGTLLDTSGDLTAAVNHTLAMAGKPPLMLDEVKPMIGGGAKMMLEHGLKAAGGIAEEEFRPLYRAMMAYYTENVSVHTRPFPGAIALLDALDAMGVKYGVVTNKFESLAVRALTDLGMFDRMVSVIGVDTLGKERAKPKGDPIIELIARAQAQGARGPRAVFVGDSIYDTMSAKAAGVPSVACSFGFLMHSLEEMDADAVIDHFDELIPVLHALQSTQAR